MLRSERTEFIVIVVELRGAFDLFDRDRNGAISLAELKHVLIALNFEPTEKLLGKIMREMETDGNGSGIYVLNGFSVNHKHF